MTNESFSDEATNQSENCGNRNLRGKIFLERSSACPQLLLLPSNRSSGLPFNGVISAGSWHKLEMVLFVFLLSDMERSLPVIM